MKFGLIIPDSKKKSSTTSSTLGKNQPSKAVASIFANDDEEGDEEEKELAELRKARQASQPVPAASISTSNEFVEKLHAEALQTDPNIFDYDASLEAESHKKDHRRNVHRNLRILGQEVKTESDSEGGPKYMQNIIAKAEERKIESELIKLRNMKRKSGAVDSSTSEEVFVTSAYSQRLKELEEKEMELKARQSREEDGDVTKRKDMSGFYFNLMKRNVSFGGKIHEQNREKELEKETEKETDKELKQEFEKEHEIGKESHIDKKMKSEELVKEAEIEEEISFGPRKPPTRR